MTNCGACDRARLPDVMICGGDATPWRIKLLDEAGKPIAEDKIASVTGELVISRYGLVSGLGGDAEIPEPEISVSGTVEEAQDGGVCLTFQLDPGDTEELRGKYIYQISVDLGEGARIAQGVLTIKPNVNR